MDIKMKLTAAAMAAFALGGAGCAHTHDPMVKSGGSAAAPSAAPAPASDAKGECWGVNACKGQGACGGVGHECAGQNACKGQGWLSLSKSECDGKNGKFKAG